MDKKKYRIITLKKMIVAAALVTLCWLGLDAAPTQAGQINDPLLRVLIKKGVLTADEAVEIQAEANALEEQERKQVVQEIEERGVSAPKGLKDLSVGMVAYVDYSTGRTPLANNRSNDLNRFSLTRGYLDIKKQFTPWLGVRYTPDITQENGGDWKFRTKYLYTEFRPGDVGFLTDLKSELGMGHIPWLDFEEHVNRYRSQGTMPIERAGTFNSADLGLSIMGNLGGKLEDAAAKTGNSHYDGRYGSWHFGVYNGAGYHAKENNTNKVVEGRLTVRPLPETLPGLQLSYFGLYGEGNQTYNGVSPDYVVNLGMLSYEHPRFTLSGQYFTTEGNASGTLVDAQNKALDTAAYSLFANVRLPVLNDKLSAFCRWDHFDADKDDRVAADSAYDLYIAGLAYDLYKGNMITLAYETTDYEIDSGGKGKTPVAGNNLGDDHKAQVVYQIKF